MEVFACMLRQKKLTLVIQDAHHVQISIKNESPFEDWSFFAVFDGHAGSKVAFHSAQNLLHTLLDTAPFKEVCYTRWSIINLIIV
jgi:serine/threonine protein phosphatase PrpC